MQAMLASHHIWVPSIAEYESAYCTACQEMIVCTCHRSRRARRGREQFQRPLGPGSRLCSARLVSRERVERPKGHRRCRCWASATMRKSCSIVRRDMCMSTVLGVCWSKPSRLKRVRRERELRCSMVLQSRLVHGQKRSWVRCDASFSRTGCSVSSLRSASVPACTSIL